MGWKRSEHGLVLFPWRIGLVAMEWNLRILWPGNLDQAVKAWSSPGWQKSQQFCSWAETPSFHSIPFQNKVTKYWVVSRIEKNHVDRNTPIYSFVLGNTWKSSRLPGSHGNTKRSTPFYFSRPGRPIFPLFPFFQNGKRISAICSNYGVMIDGETYETLEYLLTSLNTHIRIAMSKANCYFHLRVPWGDM